MTSLKTAFQLQLNTENAEFIKYPYKPLKQLAPLAMKMTARAFDVKYGAKNCFYPAHPSWACNSK
jgi:hypothetical protein